MNQEMLNREKAIAQGGTLEKISTGMLLSLFWV